MLPAITALWAANICAQGYGPPLTMQGLHRLTNASVGARGSGGVTTGRWGDVSQMFSQPASLVGLDGVRVSAGGGYVQENSAQDQRWLPLRTLPTFSLMMDGLLDRIRDPDYTDAPDDGFGPEDSIGRPYDSIHPDWSRSRSMTRPANIVVAAPVELWGIPFVFGAGMSEYANLNSTFLNNNVLSPSIGTQRPSGVPRPAAGQEVPVMWNAYERVRTGSLSGYGITAAAGISETIRIGVGARIISGTTDDVERTISRGRILFGNNDGVYYYKVDSVYGRWSTVGISSFSGSELMLNAALQFRQAAFSLAIWAPTSVERSFTGTTTIDTTGVPGETKLAFTDRITQPLRASAGLAVKVREDVTLGMEYESRPYASASYRSASGSATSPWLSISVFRAGLEYNPLDWLTLRGGLRRDAEVYEAEGNAIPGEPVRYTALSAGAGFTILGAHIDVAYEFADITYQDAWQTNVNINDSGISHVLASLSYTIR